MLLTETDTQQWTSQDLEGWLKNAGFAAPARVALSPADKGSLLTVKLRPAVEQSV